MSSIFSRFIGVSKLNLKTAIAIRRFHYNHGIPGIPVDGKVVLLNNSKNGSQTYLVGTFHESIGSANTVKKVINHVRPDSVAIEMCKKRARLLSQGRVNPSLCMDMV
ncbi:hypothetical protein MKW94_008818, partial [Papaver nudicaule]|nr:hypothetical protein [Papaver nudicaule]